MNTSVLRTETPPASSPAVPAQQSLRSPASAPAPSFWRNVAAVAGWYALTFGLLTLIFHPVSIWPLAFIALTPWAVATCTTPRAWLAHWLSFLGGWVFFAWNLSWLIPVTGLGLTALALYLALYWTLAAWAIRNAHRRGLSMVWVLPVVWVACEYLRAFVMTGFPWLFLAHGAGGLVPLQDVALTLIQISDLGGAYAVSFVMALVSGWLAALWLYRRQAANQRGRTQLVVGGVVTGAVLLATVAYGLFRLQQSADLKLGPKVTVLQHDFPLHPDPRQNASLVKLFADYFALAATAAVETEPDLIVFPETIGRTQNADFVQQDLARDHDELRAQWWWGRFFDSVTLALARGDYATGKNHIKGAASLLSDNESLTLPETDRGPATPLVLGTTSIELSDTAYPDFFRFNSAIYYHADGQQDAQRYDKRHLVPFGEVVPFRSTRFHWLYLWLNQLSPFSDGGTYEYSLTPGDELTVFELETRDGQGYRFGTPICYEDVMPYLVREYVWGADGRRVDFLLNMSNDGWFLHSAELPQHLAICAFRAIENRISIARSVNTGISGFIDPDGRVRSIVRPPNGAIYGPGAIGFAAERVKIDDRRPLYGVLGDWLPRLCLLLTTILWIEGVAMRWVRNLVRRFRTPKEGRVARV